MLPKPKLNVHSFPRPPLLEKTPRHLVIKWNSATIADTRDAFWVLETTHPPTYYLPRSSISVPLQRTGHTSFCEWKGQATYYSLSPPPPSAPSATDSDSGATTTKPTKPTTTTTTPVVAKNKAWSYENPSAPAFAPLKGYVSFYANAPWECFVDGEKVEAQEGDFYGGWVTSELEGRMKGGPGTWGW